MEQVKDQGFCTKSQLEYLVLYNEIEEVEKPYHLSKDEIENTVFLEDESEKSNEHPRKSFSTKLPQLNVNALPEELKEKFDMLKQANLTF